MRPPKKTREKKSDFSGRKKKKRTLWEVLKRLLPGEHHRPRSDCRPGKVGAFIHDIGPRKKTGKKKGIDAREKKKAKLR